MFDSVSFSEVTFDSVSLAYILTYNSIYLKPACLPLCVHIRVKILCKNAVHKSSDQTIFGLELDS